MSNINLFGAEPETPEVIRALWWKQPYASLMLQGKIETRTYPTKVRGKVLICACKRGYDYELLNEIAGNEQYRRIIETQVMDYVADNDLYGKAISIGDLVDCRPMKLEDEDICFAKYRKPWTEERQIIHPKTGLKVKKIIYKSLYCWVFKNVKFIKPFDIDGKQGWAILTPDVIDKINIISSKNI